MVDTARLVAKVETKGVKRATDELEGFSDSAQEADSSTQKLGKTLKSGAAFVAKAGVALGAAGTALAVFATKTADAQKEWQNLSKIANDSVDTFKATAFATEQVGISAEKLADISKDTNEKLGEFIATGGGGFKDFFEQVAPLVDLTAEELQGLSGPQVLGRVQQAFEQANVPLEQQSFYLESIASDTTALIPLLANEGRELERLTGQYARLNEQLELTTSEQGGLRALSASFDLLSTTTDNAAGKISATLAPTLDSFFSSVAESVPTATQALIEFFNVFIATENLATIGAVEERLAGINEEIEKLEGRNLRGGGRSGAGDRSRLARLRDEAAEATQRIKELKEEQARLEDANLFSISGISAEGGRFNSIESNLRKEEDLIRESFERRKELQRDYENAQLESEQAYQSAREDALGQGLSAVSTLTTSSNKELFRIGQAAAVSNAVVNIAEGVTKALSLGPIIGPALAGAISAAGAVQLATISQQKPPSARQQGGQFSRGQDLLVGEKGPELVRFNSGGRIATADQTASMGNSAPSVVVNNYASGTKATAETMSDGRVRVIVNEVLNAEVTQPNSQFNKNLDRTRKVQRQF